MIGAIIGDIVGSRFEFRNCRTKDFEFFHRGCYFTDDSVMTIAIGKAVSECGGDTEKLSLFAVKYMQEIGRLFPDCGYGGYFHRWVFSADPQPYNSFGNGAAMRVSACGDAAKTLEEAKAFSHAVTKVTHNHPEGLKGAEATAVAVFLAKSGKSKAEIAAHIRENYYALDFTIDGLRPAYCFDVTCQGSVPQAIEAFLESTDFEDAVRTAISLGGDSDTLAAIAGGIAGAFYGVPDEMIRKAKEYLEEPLLSIVNSISL